MMTEFKWSREATHNLIYLLEQNKCLWDVSDNEYKKRISREAAIDSILQEIQFYYAAATKIDIKNKIHSLRSQYRKEVRHIERSKRSGHVRQPSLWCYDFLHFLNLDPDSQSTSQLSTTVSRIKSPPSPEVISESDVYCSDRAPSPECAMSEELNEPEEEIENSLNSERFDWLASKIATALAEFSNEAVVDKTIIKLQQILHEGKVEDSEYSYNQNHQPAKKEDIKKGVPTKRKSTAPLADSPHEMKKIKNHTQNISEIEEVCMDYWQENKKIRLDEDPRRMFLLSLMPEVQKLSEKSLTKFKMKTMIMLDGMLEQHQEDDYRKRPLNSPNSEISNDAPSPMPSLSSHHQNDMFSTSEQYLGNRSVSIALVSPKKRR